MKRAKFLIVCMVVFAGFSMLFAIEPQATKTTKLATRMVEKTGADITLTDSQKTVLKKAAELFFQKRGMAALRTGNESSEQKKNAEVIYKATLDSLLTPEQKKQLEAKRAERQRGNMNK